MYPACRLRTNLAKGVGKLAKPMIALAGCLNLLGEVGRNLRAYTTRQSGLPFDHVPLTIPATILARPNERSPQTQP